MNRTPSALVRLGADEALFQLVGRGPDEWLGIGGSLDLPDEEDLDWDKADAIEAEVRAEAR